MYIYIYILPDVRFMGGGGYYIYIYIYIYMYIVYIVLVLGFERCYHRPTSGLEHLQLLLTARLMFSNIGAYIANVMVPYS